MTPAEPLRIAWLTTGRGPGSYGALETLFEAIDDGLPVELAVVFVNRERGEYAATDRLLDLLDARHVPVETLSSVRFRKQQGGERSRPGEPLPPWRRAFDEAAATRLARYSFDLAVMFGYMLIATRRLYDRFPIINDHPALPDGPRGAYQEVIAELIGAGAEESGCMYHLVTGDLDRGPVLSYCRFPIPADPSAHVPPTITRAEIEALPLYDEIRARGVARERPFLIETLRALQEGDLTTPASRPLDLTAKVEEGLSRSV
jgi:folate-dependent phosphoribosylglycinamide formyltransferase PurN